MRFQDMAPEGGADPANGLPNTGKEFGKFPEQVLMLLR
jgi:hypothetical protein